MKIRTCAVALVLSTMVGVPSLAAENPSPAAPAMSEAARIPAPEKLIDEVLLPEQRALMASEARRWLADALSPIQVDEPAVLAEKNPAHGPGTAADGAPAL